MRIKILEKILHEGKEYAEGEERVVTDELGSFFCSQGWASDAEGKVPTGDRDLRPKRLSPDNLNIYTR